MRAESLVAKKLGEKVGKGLWSRTPLQQRLLKLIKPIYDKFIVLFPSIYLNLNIINIKLKH